MLDRLLRRFRHLPPRQAFEPGHFYSPVVNPVELATRAATIWAPRRTRPGIDFNEASHKQWLDKLRDEVGHFRSMLSSDIARYTLDNDQFGGLDALATFAFVNARRPAKVVEIGSGFSSLLFLDAARSLSDYALTIKCIEPYPRPFLRSVAGEIELVEEKLQDVDYSIFDSLEADDLVFVDSSHVGKTGSDVNEIMFEVIPRLKPGVYLHFHDIFLPGEYPKDWVLTENRSWNEQYLLQAFLMYNDSFNIEFSSSFAVLQFPEQVASLEGVAGLKLAQSAGSLWIKSVGRREIFPSTRTLP